MRKLYLILLVLITSPAIAQDAGGLSDRLNRLERDITFLQRQIYRGANVDPSAAGAPIEAGSGAAQLQVQISQIETQMRQIRGGLEQVQYSQSKIKQDLKLLSEDIDFRLKALEEAARQPSEEAAAEEEKNVPEENAKEAQAASEDSAVKKTAPPKNTQPEFNDSDTHYNFAFDLLNKKQYDKAAASFTGFVREYPKDPLVPNALYWLGESYYARGDYVRAADGFRRGYEAAPEGQKAADNLLKLGLSLANVKRKEEACVVLTQVITKYDQKSQAATHARAEQAKARLECGK
jgi:tol-pal system protein YbgF